MEDIMSFSSLMQEDKNRVYEFIRKIDENYNRDLEETMLFFQGEIFSKGDNLLILCHENRIVATMGVITKEVEVSGYLFISEVYVDKEFYKSGIVRSGLGELMKNILHICNIYEKKKIRVGLRYKMNFIEEFILDYSFHKVDEALIMTIDRIKEGTSSDNCVTLHPLTEESKELFMRMHNNGFMGTPNSDSLSIEEVEAFIHMYGNNNELIGIIKLNNTPIGMYMLTIEGELGWIDNIALIDEYRGKGYGKKIVAKVIQILKPKAKEIGLLVMTSNNIAYNLYKIMGFKEKKIFSTWYEKEIIGG